MNIHVHEQKSNDRYVTDHVSAVQWNERGHHDVPLLVGHFVRHPRELKLGDDTALAGVYPWCTHTQDRRNMPVHVHATQFFLVLLEYVYCSSVSHIN